MHLALAMVLVLLAVALTAVAHWLNPWLDPTQSVRGPGGLFSVIRPFDYRTYVAALLGAAGASLVL